MFSSTFCKLSLNILLVSLSSGCVDSTSFKSAERVSATENPVLQQEESHSLEFRYGDPHPKVDYLFIIDNSVSMQSIVSNTRSGFSALMRQDTAFSPDSQIAVMSSMIGDLSDLSRTGPDIRRYPGIEFEPGFLDFVDQSSILNYREKSPDNSQRWPIDGCDKKWFAPGEKNDKGQYCFEAALQSTYAPVGAEPGIHAFFQLLLKNKGQNIFRNQSLLNVIFISDTHDPGINRQTLMDTRPSYEQIVELLNQGNEVEGLKFHALAPDSPCTGELVYDRSYYKLADISGGNKGDVCTLTDYSGFLREMIARSRAKEPVFRLGIAEPRDLRVLLDGMETKDYYLNDGKDMITIPGLLPDVPVTVTISFASR